MQRLVSFGHLWLLVATFALMACSTVESRREVELFSRLIDIAKQDHLLDRAALSKNLGVEIVEDTTYAIDMKKRGMRERRFVPAATGTDIKYLEVFESDGPSGYNNIRVFLFNRCIALPMLTERFGARLEKDPHPPPRYGSVGYLKDVRIPDTNWIQTFSVWMNVPTNAGTNATIRSESFSDPEKGCSTWFLIQSRA